MTAALCVGRPVVEMAAVDRLAIEFVCNGTPMPLNRLERAYAIQAMVGRVGSAEMARRLGTYDNEVTRTLKAIGAVMCPGCQRLQLQDAGILRPHIDQWGAARCAMSGQRHDDRNAIILRRAWTAVASDAERARRGLVAAS